MKKHVTLGIIGSVLLLFLRLFTVAGSSAEKFSPYVDDQGSITLPEVYRIDWACLGSWIVPDEKAPGYGFHNVYTQRGTEAAYQETGRFPDSAILVKEIRKISSADLPTGHASWAGDMNLWFVMIKDTEGRFPGNPNWGNGWGWAMFKADDPMKNVCTDFKKDCIGCHMPAKNTDWVFIQGYPDLR
jgi:hypothetical protein